MPKFRVLRRVDAFVDDVVDIEADSAEEAASAASDDERKFDWKEVGVHAFDARYFVALDEDGNEIEATAQGDF